MGVHGWPRGSRRCLRKRERERERERERAREREKRERGDTCLGLISPGRSRVKNANRIEIILGYIGLIYRTIFCRLNKVTIRYMLLNKNVNIKS